MQSAVDQVLVDGNGGFTRSFSPGSMLGIAELEQRILPTLSVIPTGTIDPEEGLEFGRSDHTRRVHSRVRPTAAKRNWHLGLFATILLCLTAFLAVGAIGVSRYVETFWKYRGYPPPAHVKVISEGSGANRRLVPVASGSVSTIEVKSPALGGRSIPVVIYLPPNYVSDLAQRYPVLYLLHGFPGSPAQFIDVGDIAVHSNILVAEHKMGPTILVMPSGAGGFFSDNEWANSIRPQRALETFVAHDLVNWIDSHYRTLTSGSERGIAGLSEGGYGAVNIAFHHVGEFDLIESWSGYFVADVLPTLFGTNKNLLAYNSPKVQLPFVASQLKHDHTYLWLYSGRHDVTRPGNVRFANQLQAFGVAHHWKSYPGLHHNWKLWRSLMGSSLMTASNYFEHGNASA